VKCAGVQVCRCASVQVCKCATYNNCFVSMHAANRCAVSERAQQQCFFRHCVKNARSSSVFSVIVVKMHAAALFLSLW